MEEAAESSMISQHETGKYPEEAEQRLPTLKVRPPSGSSTSTGADGSHYQLSYPTTNFGDGRRFSFSPLLFTQSTAGKAQQHLPLPEHVITEIQSECESSFKQPESKDIVHQYFDFLHQEVSARLIIKFRMRN